MSVGDLSALALGSGILGAQGVLGACLGRIHSRAAFAVATLVLGAASVVFLSTAASFFDLYQRVPMLVGQATLLLGTGAVWLVHGRPSPPGNWIPGWRELLAVIQRHQAIAALSVAFLCALAVEAVLAIVVAPNNFDSMTYHLARVGYWFQYDSIFHFPGGSFRQLQLPANAEILQGWTMLLSNSDRFAQLVQLTAQLATGLAVYLGARMLRFSRAGSAFASLLFVTLPEVVLQSTTTQNDLIAAFFIAACAIFLVRSITTQALGELLIAAAALGLAFGTKGTIFFAGPGLLLITVVAILRSRPPRRSIAVGVATLAGATLLLGSTSYVQNAITYGHPFGEVRSHLERERPIQQNTAAIGWQFVDFPGFDGAWVVTAIRDVSQKLLGPNAENVPGKGPGFTVAVDTAVHEDYTAFGPVGLLIFLPVLTLAALRRGPRPRPRVLAVAALSYFAAMALVLEANPFIMRYAITGMALGAPLLARVEESSWLRVLCVAGAVFVLVPSLALNAQKPLGFADPAAFLEAARSSQQSASQGPVRTESLRELDELLASDAAIVLVAGVDAWEYPLFGPHFDRKVTRVDAKTADAEHLEMIIERESPDAVVWAEVRDSPLQPPDHARDLGAEMFITLEK